MANSLLPTFRSWLMSNNENPFFPYLLDPSERRCDMVRCAPASGRGGVGASSLIGAGLSGPAPWNTCDRCRVSEIPPACPSHVCVPRCGCRIALFDPRKGNAGQNSHAIAPMGREVWGTTERAVDGYAALSTRPFVTRSVWDRPVSTCYSPGRTDGRVEGRPSDHTIAGCETREISQKGNRR